MEGSKHQIFVRVGDELLIPLLLEVEDGRLKLYFDPPSGHPLEQEAIGFLEELADECRGAELACEESIRETDGEHRTDAILFGV